MSAIGRIPLRRAPKEERCQPVPTLEQRPFSDHLFQVAARPVHPTTPTGGCMPTGPWCPSDMGIRGATHRGCGCVDDDIARVNGIALSDGEGMVAIDGSQCIRIWRELPDLLVEAVGSRIEEHLVAFYPRQRSFSDRELHDIGERIAKRGDVKCRHRDGLSSGVTSQQHRQPIRCVMQAPS